MSSGTSLGPILMSTDTVGGVWTYSIELARGLAERGHHVVLAAMGAPPSPAQQAEARAVDGLIFHARPYKLAWMEDPWEDIREAGGWLKDLAREYRPALVHLNTLAHGDIGWELPLMTVLHSCVMSWFSAVRGALPFESIHLKFVEKNRRRLPPHDTQRWERYHALVTKSLRASDTIITPSAWISQQIRSHYDHFNDIRVIYNGRNPENFRPARAQNYILSAGRLWDEAKNAHQLASAAELIKWPVYIAGSSTHPDGGSAQFKNVECLGQLSPEELAGYFSRSAIYVLPARYEPFGLSILEAALAGNALVLGNIPSLREIWGDAALFVDPDNPEDIAAATNLLIDERALRRDFTQRAARRARLLTSERMVENYLDIYQELTARRAKREQFSAKVNINLMTESRGGRH